MARGDITQKISLDGDAEVKRKLEQLGATGERAFAGLNKGAQTAAPHFQRMEGSSKQLGFAVRNLSFQANDLFTSLASGAPVMQVFAQQGGQIMQAFQQGGGAAAVLGGAAKGIASLITPMRLAGAAAVTAAAGFAVLIGRAAEIEGSARQFAVIQKVLTALPQAVRGGDKLDFSRLLRNISPQELEAAARRLREFGLSYSESIQKITEALRAGVPSGLAERIVSIGQNIEAALGKGFGERFTKAIGEKDIEALRKLAAQLRIIGENSTAAQDGLSNIPALIEAIDQRVKGLHRESLGPFGKAIEDLRIGFDNFLTELTKQIGVPALENLEAQLQSIREIFKNPEELFKGISFGSLLTRLFAPPEAGATDPLFGIQDWVRTNIGEPFRIWATSEWPALLATFVAEFQKTRPQIEAAFTDLGSWIIQTFGPALSEPSIWQGFVSAASAAVNAVRGLLASLSAAAMETARAIAAAFSTAMQGRAAATANLPTGFIPAFGGVPDLTGSGGFARGGLVRGPGTGISDSIRAALSNGEFVVNAAATSRFLPLLRMINDGLSMPLVPKSRFATGGLVMAGAGSGGGTVNLHLDGHSFAMRAESDVFDGLVKVARAKQLLSAGRKPGWAGGRRYGG